MAELADRMEREREVARALARVSSLHRRRLLDLLGDPPDPRNVPPEFWREVERDERAKLILLLLGLVVASGEQHVGLLVPADRRAGATIQVADAATIYAERRATEVARRYAETSRLRLDDIGNVWWGRPQATPEGDIAADVLSIFGPERDATIAATETTAAATHGATVAADSARAAGVQVKVTWFTAADDKVCPICAPLHGARMSQWETSGLPSQALVAITMNQGPPAHPNCRCWIETEVIADGRPS